MRRKHHRRYQGRFARTLTARACRIAAALRSVFAAFLLLTSGNARGPVSRSRPRLHGVSRRSTARTPGAPAALLALAAFGFAGAALAQDVVLVSNDAQNTSSIAWITIGANDQAQGFTTGTHDHGYRWPASKSEPDRAPPAAT